MIDMHTLAEEFKKLAAFSPEEATEFKNHVRQQAAYDQRAASGAMSDAEKELHRHHTERVQEYLKKKKDDNYKIPSWARDAQGKPPSSSSSRSSGSSPRPGGYGYGGASWGRGVNWDDIRKQQAEAARHYSQKMKEIGFMRVGGTIGAGLGSIGASYATERLHKNDKKNNKKRTGSTVARDVALEWGLPVAGALGGVGLGYLGARMGKAAAMEKKSTRVIDLSFLIPGYYAGKNVAGDTAAGLAPEGRKTRSESVARSLAMLGGPAGGVAGLSVVTDPRVQAAISSLKNPLLRDVARTFSPAVGAVGGSMLGGLATGAGVGLVQKLRGPTRGGEKTEKTANSLMKISMFEAFCDEMANLSSSDFLDNLFKVAALPPATLAPGGMMHAESMLAGLAQKTLPRTGRIAGEHNAIVNMARRAGHAGEGGSSIKSLIPGSSKPSMPPASHGFSIPPLSSSAPGATLPPQATIPAPRAA